MEATVIWGSWKKDMRRILRATTRTLDSPSPNPSRTRRAQSPGVGVQAVTITISLRTGANAGSIYKRLFRSAGMDLHDTSNVMEVMASNHRGRHTNKYHDMVLTDIEAAIKSADRNSRAKRLSESEMVGPRRDAVRRVLDKWQDRIRNDPGVMYTK